MKTFLITTALLVSFLGCSHNNAFDRFEMSQERELSEENIQSSKLTYDSEINGVVTAVYLNKTNPDFYKDAEYFYIYLNLEEGSEKPKFMLNNLPSIFVEELNSSNPYTKLTLFNAEWKQYYLVGFQKAKDRLKLTIRNEKFSSAELIYKKE